jgi:hypothetical protein
VHFEIPAAEGGPALEKTAVSSCFVSCTGAPELRPAVFLVPRRTKVLQSCFKRLCLFIKGLPLIISFLSIKRLSFFTFLPIKRLLLCPFRIQGPSECAQDV